MTIFRTFLQKNLRIPTKCVFYNSRTHTHIYTRILAHTHTQLQRIKTNAIFSRFETLLRQRYIIVPNCPK